MRSGDRVRGQGRIRRRIRYLHGESGIAEEHVTAGLEADTQSLAEEQRRETTAVDEQIAGNRPRLAREHALDVAGLALFDLCDVRQDVAHAKLLGAVLREEGCELA